jgi:hypothetical protein
MMNNGEYQKHIVHHSSAIIHPSFHLMSLINQALRKAQRDRTPSRRPLGGEQTPTAYASSTARGMRPALVIGLVIAVAILVGLVAGLSVVIFKGDSTPLTRVAAAPAATPQSDPVAEPPSSAPAPAPLDVLPSPPAATRPAAPAATPSDFEELRKARAATEAEVAIPATAAAQPSEDIIAWLGNAKLSGVRISDTESKVIVNGKAYAVGDYVHYKLGIKIMLIQERQVLFVDLEGKKYMKRL